MTVPQTLDTTQTLAPLTTDRRRAIIAQNVDVDRLERIVALYRSGMSTRAVGRAVGLTGQTVWELLARRGLIDPARSRTGNVEAATPLNEGRGGEPTVNCAICKRDNVPGASRQLCVRCRDRYLEISAEDRAA